MAFCDFRVRYDPEKDTPEELTKRILYSIIIRPLKGKKPRVMFVGGDSGEGKSLGVLRLQELLLEIQGLDIKDYMEAINVFTPLEYPQKLDGLLFKKELKKANIITMHEAREVVKAKNWQNFLTQSIADVNAMSRSLKRLLIIVISQFIRDITTDIRYTINYYCVVRRPLGHKARLYINVMWKDDRDVEKPRLRKRKLSGYIIDSQGRHRRYVPRYLEMSLPPKEIVELFDRKDTEAKAVIIKKKINKLIKEMKDDIGDDTGKVEAMVNWYMTHPDSLHTIGKRIKGNWRTHSSFRDMHELNNKEVKEFHDQLNQRLKDAGVIEEEGGDNET